MNKFLGVKMVVIIFILDRRNDSDTGKYVVEVKAGGNQPANSSFSYVKRRTWQDDKD